MRKILHVASEATPYASAGGLGDVIGSLPKALKAQYGDDADIRVIMPLYSNIDSNIRDMLKEVYVTSIQLAWRWQYCGLYSIETDGVIYYFIDVFVHGSERNQIYTQQKLSDVFIRSYMGDAIKNKNVKQCKAIKDKC